MEQLEAPMILNLGRRVGPEVAIQGWSEQEVYGLIRQRSKNDCGVASMAMAAGISYDEAKQFFGEAGLSIKRAKKQPFSSNFRELQLALELAGITTRRSLFRGWSSLGKAAILKVDVRKNGNWHWVYAGRHDDHGLFVMDPACDLPSYERNFPLDVMCRKLEAIKPSGNFIDIAE